MISVCLQGAYGWSELKSKVRGLYHLYKHECHLYQNLNILLRRQKTRETDAACTFANELVCAQRCA